VVIERRVDGAPVDDQAMLDDAAMRTWWSYSRAAEHESVVTRARVPMADGIELDCHVARPAHGDSPRRGAFPGLVAQITPYAVMRDSLNVEAAWWAARGYVVLVGNVRGTGDSGGNWQHAMSSQDGRDAAALVEWLAAQPYCDGRVGQFGVSYGGQTTYGAAVERPPHLRAIAPMESPGNLYDDVVYPGGIKTTERGVVDMWPPLAAVLSGDRFVADDEYDANRAHPTFDDYWSDRALVGRIADVDVPILAVGAWKDEFFRSGSLRLIEQGLERTWAFYGPWTHGGPVSYDEPPADGQLPAGVVLAWFDRWVRDDERAPVPPRPTFASFEGPEGTGRGWRLLPEWRPTGSDVRTWRLGADATLSDDGAAGIVTIEQPRDPDEDGGARSFTSEALEIDRVLVGWPVLEFDAILSGADAHFYVELFDFGPDGNATLVNDGFLKASHRRSHVAPEAVRPGVRERYAVTVRAGHWRFPVGHRVSVRISGGGHDRLVPPTDPVRVDLATGPNATLSLPGFAAEP
jgi:predicted acyl esterase